MEVVAKPSPLGMYMAMAASTALRKINKIINALYTTDLVTEDRGLGYQLK
jgi:hypothetical protein